MTNKKNIFTSVLALIIYWGIVYFLIKKTWNGEFTLNHIIGSMEFVSAITVIIAIILLISKILGNFIVGIVVGLIACVALCGFADTLAASNNFNDQTIQYILVGIGIVFNIIMLLRIIGGFRNPHHAPVKNAIDTDNSTAVPIDTADYSDTNISIDDELTRQELLSSINNNFKQMRERK